MCLLHESDYDGDGIAGLALFWIEHLDLQSRVPARRDDYTNLVWTCRRCNRARGIRPRRSRRGRLLDPARHAWANHFQHAGDRIVPRPGNRRAAHTHEVYDIDAVGKVRRRRKRRLKLRYAIPLLRDASARWRALQTEAALTGAARRQLLAEARTLHRAWALASLAAAQHALTPASAPRKCLDPRAKWQDLHTLPRELQRQGRWVDVESE